MISIRVYTFCQALLIAKISETFFCKFDAFSSFCNTVKVCGEIWCKVGPIFGRRTNKRDCHFMPKLGLIRKFLKKEIQTFQITFFCLTSTKIGLEKKKKQVMKKRSRKLEMFSLFQQEFFWAELFWCENNQRF